jgi:integrase/recombinase XerD
MRVGEVLKLRPQDVEERKLMLKHTKAGREWEVVYIPHKLADWLKEYIRERKIEPDQRIFPSTYPAARMIVNKAGLLVRIRLMPHDLRRNTVHVHPERNTPEVISKVIV